MPVDNFSRKRKNSRHNARPQQRNKKSKFETMSKEIPPSSTIIVNNLSYDTDKETLADIFVNALSIRVAKGFAFIDFSNIPEAKEVLSRSNGLVINSRPVRLEYCKNSHKQSSTLYVFNLPQSVTSESLKEMFSNAIAIRMVEDKITRKFKRQAFVEFSNVDEANAAKKAMEDQTIEGNKIYIQYCKEKLQKEPYKKKANKKSNNGPDKTLASNSESSKNQLNKDEPSKRLYINNLSYDTTVDDLKKVFSTAKSVNIPLNNGKCVGFGFVSYKSLEEAIKAKNQNDKKDILGTKINTAFSKCSSNTENPEKPPSKKLIIRSLNAKTTEKVLKRIFPYAINVHLAIDESGASRRFAFVDFESVEIATSAKQKVKSLGIDGAKVNISFAIDKNKAKKKK